MDNQLSFWYTNQVVTSAQMNDCTQDMYLRFTEITAVSPPYILWLGGIITIVSGTANIPAGSFRFLNQTINGYNTSIWGDADADAIAGITGNGFLIARVSISNAIGQYNYPTTVTYLYVATVVPATDCLLAVVIGGVISSFGNFYINTAAANTDVIGAIATPGNATTQLALTPGNLQTIYNGQTTCFNRLLDLEAATTYDIVPEDNFTILINNGASPIVYTLDTTANTFLYGSTIAIDNNVVGQVSLTLIIPSATYNFTPNQLGLSMGQLLVIITDGADSIWLNGQDASVYFPVITQNTLPISASLYDSTQYGISAGSSANISYTTIITNNNSISYLVDTINLPPNTTFKWCFNTVMVNSSGNPSGQAHFDVAGVGFIDFVSLSSSSFGGNSNCIVNGFGTTGNVGGTLVATVSGGNISNSAIAGQTVVDIQEIRMP